MLSGRRTAKVLMHLKLCLMISLKYFKEDERISTEIIIIEGESCYVSLGRNSH